jgi:23S rRNA G2069 N7-methylase RlmK/C1962 C5-methylase RlmI
MNRSSDTLRALLSDAFARRGDTLPRADLFRAFDGAGDGLADLFIDRIGPFCLAHVLLVDGACDAIVRALRELAPWYAELCGVEALYVRVHAKDPKQTSAEAAHLLWGREVAEAIVREHGISFFARPSANVNAGVFLDTRELRAKLLSIAMGARVLNTFCFTGTLGLAAALGGAVEIVQLDSSKRMLNWARDNESLNTALIPGRIRYVGEDCLTFMERECRRLEQGKISAYDIVILDPPSFGRADGKVFRFERDLDALLAASTRLFGEKGTLCATTNVRTLTHEHFLMRCRDALTSAPFKITAEVPLSAPVLDFPSRGADSIAMKGAIFSLARIHRS